jgi:hypothetical protein
VAGNRSEVRLEGTEVKAFENKEDRIGCDEVPRRLFLLGGFIGVHAAHHFLSESPQGFYVRLVRYRSVSRSTSSPS